MVRNYKRKSDQQNWSKEAMKMAVSKVRSKEMTLGHAADVYDVPKTTLFRRMRKDGHLDEVTRKGLDASDQYSHKSKKMNLQTTSFSWRIDFLGLH